MIPSFAALPILPILSLLPVGAVLGFFGGLFGIGGGIIAIPLLMMVFGMEQATAQGTALVMMVPNLLIAWWRYMRKDARDLKGALGVALVATVMTGVFAHLAQRLNSAVMLLLFALFLLALGLNQIHRSRTTRETPPARITGRWLPLVGIVSGGSMGLLGIGGGLVATPLFTGLFGKGQRAAQSLALALVTPSAVMALYTYADHQRVDWPVGVALGVGGLATVASGVALAHRWPERTLQRAFGIMLIATAVVLVVKKATGL